MDLPESKSTKVYTAIYFVTLFSTVIQLTVLSQMSVKIWKSRNSSGISINFMLLCIVAFLFKYVNGQMDQLIIPPVLDFICFSQYWGRIFWLVLMVPTVLILLCFLIYDGKKVEDKFDMWCFPVGFIVSLLLGADQYLNTAKDMWMIGSYLEVVAWIPQLKLSLERKPVDYRVMLFIVSMFTYEILNITGFSYDFYRLSLYGNVGYKLVVLKLLFFCGFFLNYWQLTSSTKNKVNKVIPTTPAKVAPKKNLRLKKRSEKSIYYIYAEDQISLTEKGLTTRY